MSPHREGKRLRILIANERKDRLAVLADEIAGLGHEVIAREINVDEVGAVTAKEAPDVAFVGLGVSSAHALDLISEIVREASCPVIALLSAREPDYVREAAKRGVFAYVVDGTPEELQSAIDIALLRFADSRTMKTEVERLVEVSQALVQSHLSLATFAAASK